MNDKHLKEIRDDIKAMLLDRACQHIAEHWFHGNHGLALIRLDELSFYEAAYLTSGRGALQGVLGSKELREEFTTFVLKSLEELTIDRYLDNKT